MIDENNDDDVMVMVISIVLAYKTYISIQATKDKEHSNMRMNTRMKTES